MTIKEELDKKKIDFPEGKIVTLDGRILDCYSIAKENVRVVDDQIKLDTTGRYLSIGRKREAAPPIPKEKEEQASLFINNAFYLLAHKERIMSDSRMFLCPVAVQSGIAYTGTSGFRRPTLGIYLEWWSLAPEAMQMDEDGQKLLVYQIAGSPLSGINHCGAIRDDGMRKKVTLQHFGGNWGPFTLINMRYNAAKYMYQAYTLQNVLDILYEEDNGNTDYNQNLETQYMKHEIDRLYRQLEVVEERCKNWKNKCYETIAKYNSKRIFEYYAQYEVALAKANAEIEKLREQKKALKAELKSGKLDNISYQKTLTPLKRKIEEWRVYISTYRYTKICEAFPDEDNINFHIIENFVLTNRKKQNEK